jgi:hypothetical protein
LRIADPPTKELCLLCIGLTNSMELSTIREAPSCEDTSIVSQHFMEPEGSIPNSQELSTCSYPEPDQCIPRHHIPPLQGLVSPTINLYPFLFSPIRATCSANLIILDAIILIVLGEEYKSRTLCRITYTRSSSPHSCYMPRPSHHPRLDYSNCTW